MNHFFISNPVAAVCMLVPVLLAAPVHADRTDAADRGKERAERFPIVLADITARANKRLAKMDTDGSGMVDATEFTTHAKARPDHKRERRAHHSKHREGKHGRFGPRRHRDGERHEHRAEMRAAVDAQLFALLDENGDGQLSSEEYAAKSPELKRTARQTVMFARLDTNADGVLTALELTPRLGHLQAADTDGDGKVTRAEARAARETRRAEHGAG